MTKQREANLVVLSIQIRKLKNCLKQCISNLYKITFASGATLEIITDRSQEGAQFVKGFGGIGGKYFVAETADALETY